MIRIRINPSWQVWVVAGGDARPPYRFPAWVRCQPFMASRLSASSFSIARNAVFACSSSVSTALKERQGTRTDLVESFHDVASGKTRDKIGAFAGVPVPPDARKSPPKRVKVRSCFRPLRGLVPGLRNFLVQNSVESRDGLIQQFFNSPKGGMHLIGRKRELLLIIIVAVRHRGNGAAQLIQPSGQNVYRTLRSHCFFSAELG